MNRFVKISSLLWASSLLAGTGGLQAQAHTEPLVPKLPQREHPEVFFDDFEDQELAAEWLFVDANQDGVTWYSAVEMGSGENGSTALYCPMSNITANDWAISPVFELEAGKTYSFRFFYNSSYEPQSLNLYLGNARTVEAMTELIADLDIPINGYGYESGFIKVPSSGSYCLGFLCNSPVPEESYAGSVSVDMVEVREEIDGKVPAMVQNLKQVPGANGAQTMGLTWTNPTRTESGEPLSAITAIEIYKNMGDKTETYTGSLEPGASCSWTDPAPQAGKVSYTVYAVNQTGRSYEATVHTFVGEDVPSAPQNLQLSAEEDGIHLSWQAPAEFGLNGGWYDKSALAYRIVREPGYVLLETDAAGLSYTDPIDDLGYYYYEVTARNAKGAGGTAISEGIKHGTSMSLPFNEDFEDKSRFDALWTVENPDEKASWNWKSTSGLEEPACAFYDWLSWWQETGEQNTEADDWLFSPLLRFEKGKTYRLHYAVKGVIYNAIDLQVALGKTNTAEAMTTTIEHLRGHATTGGWESRSVEFEAPASGSFCIGFYYYNNWVYAYLDDIVVEEVAQTDLAANRIKGVSSPKAGESATYSVEVENKGSRGVRNFKVQLIDEDNKVLAEGPLNTKPLPMEMANYYPVEWTPEMAGRYTIRGRVVIEDENGNVDEIEANNLSDPFPVWVMGEGEKAVQVGDGEVQQNRLPFYTYCYYPIGQTVYPASLLEGVTGSLNGIAYQVVSALGETLTDQGLRIYVAETDRQDMSEGWFSSDELTCVFDSVISIERGSYDMYIPFNRPFEYSGGNLVVCMEGNMSHGLWGGSGGDLLFLATESMQNATSLTNVSYYPVDLDNPDNTNGIFYAQRPNTIFYFDVSNTGSVSGKVTNADGDALAEVRIAVKDMKAVQRSADDGTYSFPYLPAGNQTLSFTHVGYEDLSRNAAVEDGKNIELNVQMEARPTINISGWIAERTGNRLGLSDAKLSLEGASDYSATTDSTGSFLIENVYGNMDYALRVSAFGYVDYEDTIHAGSTDLSLDTLFMDLMVNMPSSVTAYDRKDSALVEWKEPAPVAWMQLDDGQPYGAFGGSSDEAYYVAHRYTPKDFEAKGITEKSAITKVRFFPTAIADFELCIFTGETGMETMVHSEEMPVNAYNEWHEYVLEEPFPITLERNIMVAIKVTQGSGSNPVCFDQGPAIANASLFSEDGLVWTTANEVSATMNYNWIIHTFCSANPNSRPTEVVELQSVRRQDPMAFRSVFADKTDFDQKTPALETPLPKQNPITGEYDTRMFRKAQLAKIPQIETTAADGLYEFEVFRLINGQETTPELWTAVTVAPIKEMSITDKSWRGLQDTMYRYAVRSLIDGEASDYTFSRAVDKGKYTTLNLTVNTNTGSSAAGAIVRIEGINNTYMDTVDAKGEAHFSDIHFGTYSIWITKQWYQTYTSDSLVLDQNEMNPDTITLIEDVRPPRDFAAQDYIDYVDMSWRAPAVFMETELSKGNGEYESGIGMSTGGSMEIGQRFTPEELREANVDGYQVNSISFYPVEDAEFALTIWKGDYVKAEGQIYYQEIPSNQITLGQWNEIMLDEPVIIDADYSYVFGYTATMAPNVFPCGVDNGPTVEGGDVMLYQNEWVSFYEMGGGEFNFNWMIKTMVANDNTSKSISKAEDGLDYTYQIWRLPEDGTNDAAQWTILAQEAKGVSYRDNTWTQTEDGNYYYAICSLSEHDNTSDTIFSELLQKGQNSLVTVTVSTNNSTSAEGALIELIPASEDGQAHSGTTGTDGTVQLPTVLKGNYTLRVSKAMFDEHTEQIEIGEDKTALSCELKESLTAPVAVRAMNQDNQVQVNWYSAYGTGSYPHYVTWSTGQVYSGIGQESGLNFSAAHRYEPYDIEDFRIKGTYVTKIRFFACGTYGEVPTIASFSVAIWDGSEGTLVYEQAVPDEEIVWDGWTEITLNTPYFIDGSKTVYIGYICNCTSGWPAGVDLGPVVRGKGNLINIDGGWMQLTGLATSMEYNWLIEAYCTDAEEAEMEKAEAKAEDFVQSYGVYRLKQADLYKPENWTELAPGTTQTSLTDNISGLDDSYYLYAVRAIYATGQSDYTFSNIIGKGLGNESSEAVASTMTVHPNPNHGQFSLDVPFEGDFRIFDRDGRIVMNRHLTEGRHWMDITLPAGNYLMLLVSDKATSTGKLIIL